MAVVPAVLGVGRGHEPWADLQSLVGTPLVEAATAPPSIPGLRLFAAYRARLEHLGVRWQFGFPAVGVERDGDRVTAVRSEGASRVLATRCQELVLATGGVAGNGIEANRDGSLTERVAGLPVDGFPDRLGFLGDRFLGDQPLDAAGVRVDAELRPLIDRYGRWLTVTWPEVVRAERWFAGTEMSNVAFAGIGSGFGCSRIGTIHGLRDSSAARPTAPESE